jgi:integrase/recombinase XerD
MSARFDSIAEREFREQFIKSRYSTRNSIYQIRSRIRRSCLVFREEFPSDSILNHTHTTEWLPVWNARQGKYSVKMRQNRLSVLRMWWRWLFDNRIIDDNALELASGAQLVRDTVPCITLRHHLQRHIADYLMARSDLSASTHKHYGGELERFLLFVSQSSESSATTTVKFDAIEEVLAAWFRHMAAILPHRAMLISAGVLSPFLDYLVSREVLADNALKRLTDAFPLHGRPGVVDALAAQDRTAALQTLAPQPKFRSHLADRIVGFLELKRATGCSDDYGDCVLRNFDRFLFINHEESLITNTIIARWWASHSHLATSTREGWWIVMRQFCLYLKRYVPATSIPDPLLKRLPPSNFRPRIILPNEMKVLLGAVADTCSGSRWPLRPHTYRTLLVLLYTTGLRISEALHLRVSDVDLHDRVLMIRQTKFYKSRIVPFSDGLLEILREYQQQRLLLLGAPARDAPFFLAKHGGHYKKGSIHDVWKRILRRAGIDNATSSCPRIHDLRHSFASLRVAAWYREGADVRAMLPLLATYMGHASVAGTYHYLSILPETLLASSERFRRYSGAIITPTGGNHALT